MKKIYLSVLCLISIGATAQQTFFGNGRTGFGGTLGVGSIEISNPTASSSFNFIFNRGSDLLDNAVVIFIDSRTGGFTSTAGFMDNADGLRKAISGYNSATEKSVLTFPAGFLPDFAIAFDQGFGGIWELANGGANSLNFVSSVNLTPTNVNNSNAYNFSVMANQLGITTTIGGFNFLVNYISTTAFRSNEFIGDAGPTGNPGYGDYTAITYNIYPAGVLPLTFANVNARLVNRAIRVSWTAYQEENVSHYEIYRSINGNQFGKIGTVIANGNAAEANYSFEDLQPVRGRNYYQVISVDRDGRKLSTGVIDALNGGNNTALTVYTTGSNTINLQMNSVEQGDYILRLFNSGGQLVHQYRLYHQGTDNTETINIPTSLNRGIYHLQLAGKKESFTESFMIR